MSSESSPYDAAIADVKSRIQHLETMLAGLEQLRSQATGQPLQSVASGARSKSDTEIHHDTFFGMTIGDAANKYLNIVKATKTTGEIASALERGGLKHSSKDFNTTVRSVLGGREDFLRVNGDWGLTAWYPAMRRERKAKSNAKGAEPEPDEEVSQENTREHPAEKAAPVRSTPPWIPRADGTRKAFALLAASPELTFSATMVHQKIGGGNEASTAAMLSDQARRGRIGRGTPFGYRANEETIRIAEAL